MAQDADAAGDRGRINWAHSSDYWEVLPTFRRKPDGTFISTIDGTRQTNPPIVPKAYRLGTKPALFSPQGGLRLSLEKALSLARKLRDQPLHGGWGSDPSRTIGPPDLFQSYAWGMQIFENPSFYPRPLIGHFANAYGFCGGVWYDAKAGISFAYALSGLVDGGEDDGLRDEERAIFQAISQAA